MGKQYSFPDLSELGSTIASAGSAVNRQRQQSQQVNNGQDLTPLQGLAQGLLGHQRNERMKAEDANDAARKEAMMLLSSIPDSEKNTPLKLRALAQILSMKPGKKGWYDEIFNPTPDLDYKANMLKKVMDMVPQQGQQNGQLGEGQADFSNVEDQQGKMGSYLFNADGEAVIPTIVNGKIVMNNVGKYKSAQQVVAETRSANGGIGMSTDDKRIETEAKAIAAENDNEWESLDNSAKKVYRDIARKRYAKDLETKRTINEKRPVLMDSTIEANRGKLPGQIVGESGLNPAQELAENNRILTEGLSVKKQFDESRNKYLTAWDKLKSLQQDPMLQVDGVFSEAALAAMPGSKRTKYDAVRAEIASAEREMQANAGTLENTYGSMFEVQRDGNTIPTGIIQKATVGARKVPQDGARKGAAGVIEKRKTKTGVAGIPDLVDIVMPNGSAGYYISDSVEIKTGIQGYPGQPDAYIIDTKKMSIGDPQLGDAVQIPNRPGNYEVVFKNMKGVVVVKKVN